VFFLTAYAVGGALRCLGKFLVWMAARVLYSPVRFRPEAKNGGHHFGSLLGNSGGFLCYRLDCLRTDLCKGGVMHPIVIFILGLMVLLWCEFEKRR